MSNKEPNNFDNDYYKGNGAAKKSELIGDSELPFTSNDYANSSEARAYVDEELSDVEQVNAPEDEVENSPIGPEDTNEYFAGNGPRSSEDSTEFTSTDANWSGEVKKAVSDGALSSFSDTEVAEDTIDQFIVEKDNNSDEDIYYVTKSGSKVLKASIDEEIDRMDDYSTAATVFIKNDLLVGKDGFPIIDSTDKK